MLHFFLMVELQTLRNCSNGGVFQEQRLIAI